MTIYAWDGNLPRLTSLDPATAKVLAGYNRVRPNWSGHLPRLTKCDAATAEALAGYRGSQLNLDGLAELDADAAKALARFQGPYLILDGLPTLTADAARALAEYTGKGKLCLNGLKRLDAAAASELTRCKCEMLQIAGVLKHLGQETPLTPETVRLALDHFPAESGDRDGHALPGITALDSPDAVAIAEALAKRKGPLALPTLKKISPKTLTALLKKEDIEIPLIETLELIQEPDGSVTEDFVVPEPVLQRQLKQ